jgi:hypothetical protein
MADAQSTPTYDKRAAVLAELRLHAGCEDDCQRSALGPLIRATVAEVERHKIVGLRCYVCRALVGYGNSCAYVEGLHAALFPAPLQKEPVMP